MIDSERALAFNRAVPLRFGLTVRALESDSVPSTIVLRAEGTETLFACSRLASSTSRNLCDDLGIGHPAVSHDTSSASRVAWQTITYCWVIVVTLLSDEADGLATIRS